LKFLREAVRFAPNYPEANLQLGKTLLDTNQYDAAVAALTKVPSDGPLAAEAHFFLGLAYYLSRKYDRAEIAFRFVAERVPLIEVYNNLGVVTVHNGKLMEARRYFERVTQADAREPDYRFNLGVTLYRLGDYAGAQRQLQEALSLRPQDVDAKIALEAATIGTPYPQERSSAKPPQERIKRNYDEASFHQLEVEIESLREERYALLPRADHAIAHVKNGNEMLSDGRLEQADTAFREAILLDPGNVQAHLGLARVLETRNELPEARAEAIAANRLQMTVDAFLIMARVELKQDRFDAASENLLRALRIDPTNAEAAALQQDLQKRRSSAGTAQE
jgi:tetratricopeptide (TPR) repeat protein